jgi:hypothetical protein
VRNHDEREMESGGASKGSGRERRERTAGERGITYGNHDTLPKEGQAEDVHSFFHKVVSTCCGVNVCLKSNKIK